VQGYSRLGAALHGLGRFDEAQKAYEKGLGIEPDNAQLKKALEDVKRAMEAAADDGADGAIPINSMFGNPQNLAKVRCAVLRPVSFLPLSHMTFHSSQRTRARPGT
jgi:stress-induced-phosphoprotein 1